MDVEHTPFAEVRNQSDLMRKEPNVPPNEKTYEAPKVVRISLRPEEAVSGKL